MTGLNFCLVVTPVEQVLNRLFLVKASLAKELATRIQVVTRLSKESMVEP